MANPGASDTAALTALVREWDRPRYYATLFAPAAIRDDLFTLYGFAAEIARIPDLVSNPALGEIRLQFWRDQLQAAAAGQGGGSPPALQALAAVIGRHQLPLQPFLALIDARRADLYADPPASIGDLEGFLGETQSALFQIAAIIGGGEGADTADLAGHAGVAYGLSRRLAALASDRVRGRTILPLELLASEELQPRTPLLLRQARRSRPLSPGWSASRAITSAMQRPRWAGRRYPCARFSCPSPWSRRFWTGSSG
jgi:phytoene synthase